MKRKELTIEQIKNLRDGSQVYIDYLDENEFNLEYCKTIPINTYSINYEYSYNLRTSIKGWFHDSDGNETSLLDVINYVKNNQIKVYSTDETYSNTNYNKIKDMTIEEMAESRIKYIANDDAYIGDFEVDNDVNNYVYNKEEAIEKELEWLEKCE